MSKLTSTVFVACFIFYHAEFCLGDNTTVLKVNKLEEGYKGLFTKVENFENLDIQKNLNESRDTIAELKFFLNATVQNLNRTVQNLNRTVQNLNGSTSTQTVFIVLIYVILILAFIIAFIWFKRKKDKRLTHESDPEVGENLLEDTNQPQPEYVTLRNRLLYKRSFDGDNS